MIKYPEIENHYHGDFIEKFKREFWGIEFEQYVITEKLDGSNLQLLFDFSKPKVELQLFSRKQKTDEQFFNVGEVLKRKEYQDFIEFASQNFTSKYLIFFGEIFGPGIQRRINYGPRRLLFFNMGIVFDDDSYRMIDQKYFLSYFETFSKLSGHNLTVPILSIMPNLETALNYDCNIVSTLGPQDDPENIMEGIVIQPFNQVFINNGGNTFILKKKNEKFLERTSKPRFAKVFSSEIEKLKEEFQSYITISRIISVVSKEGIPDKSRIGDYIKLVIEDALVDFHKDGFELPEDKDERKRITNVGAMVSSMLRKELSI